MGGHEHDARFLCLAVSRREGGNCIAGIDIDSGDWIRPIHSHERHAFADGELIVRDNHSDQPRFLAPLDLLSMPLQEYAGTHGQPENWIPKAGFFDSVPCVLRRCLGQRTVQFLLAHVDAHQLLLHTETDSVHADVFSGRMLSHSLCLIRPAGVIWAVAAHQKHPGKLQVRAEFRWHDITYSLVVTDPNWEKVCHCAGIGRHAHAELASAGHGLLFLTVSLAAVPYRGLHYKLVAGVIELAENNARS